MKDIEISRAYVIASICKTPKHLYKYLKRERISLGWFGFILDIMKEPSASINKFTL